MIVSIPPKRDFGLDNFAYWEDFLTLEDIRALYFAEEWQSIEDAQIGGTGSGEFNSEIRRSNVAWMHRNEKNHLIWDKIVGAICEVNRRYFHYDLTGCYEPAQLTLYTGMNNGKYNWHIDASNTDSGVARKLSMSLLLSEKHDFEGGDLEVMLESDKITTLDQKLGRAWFFPSYTLHRVTPITKGIRKSLVLWVGGPQFR